MKKSFFEHNSYNNHDSKNINTNQKAPLSPTLKFLLEMGPLVIFFLANYKGEWLINNIEIFKRFNKPLFPATAIFMMAIIVALVLSWILARKIPIMPLISGIFVLVFGSLTLWLHNDTFIKMKPTIINSLFALVLFGGLFFKKPLLRYIFDSTFKLDDLGWKKLTYRWAFFFIFLAVLNEVIWRNFSDNFWTNFKVFAIMPITVFFMLTQMPLIMKHSKDLFKEEDKTNS
ncbi:septation protein A [Bartonella henselae]|uniref:Inner membrane-spanning protein YciB n=1 Tax=Bartonella henselae (strain ATCC 49882 / DSM 28221 / CCUG 30454 / Houston 1) TaxID=283166 RepID=A0A0H3LYT8_BARHE|nr:septation protein A [Bartonella henselae]ATP13077.1 septation protein A [Bartonella henselae]OLL41400.1 septation protein A [Bartonella henselae]OLL47055.1 septation protein A [Bartonella henselae]PNM39186.1 septation protein A [Bartonella henselae str. Houston-1]UAK84059.1 septation protein A [Bartonella henselae]